MSHIGGYFIAIDITDRSTHNFIFSKAQKLEIKRASIYSK